MGHRIALVLGLMVFAVACAGVGPQPTPEFTSMHPAWTNWFTLDWAADAERSGTRRLSGYVHNGYGEEATDVQLLTQAVDASGTVVGNRITWAGNVPSLSRAYFEVRNLPAAEQYKVTVWSFSFNLKDGWE
jgi:hypothetical protein